MFGFEAEGVYFLILFLKPGRMATTQCELVPTCRVSWVSHWITLHTTQTPQTGQLGVPLDHAAHPDPTNWSIGWPTGSRCTPRPQKLVSWVSHWITLHTQTPQTGQLGVPLDHAAHPNPTNWSIGCPTGTRCTPPRPHKLVNWVSHWITLHTTQTPQTGQLGGPLEHTAHPNPTNWSIGCSTGTHCTPPKPHKLVKQFPVCSVHLTCLLPGGFCFCFCISLMGPCRPTAARWNKKF